MKYPQEYNKIILILASMDKHSTNLIINVLYVVQYLMKLLNADPSGHLHMRNVATDTTCRFYIMLTLS